MGKREDRVHNALFDILSNTVFPVVEYSSGRRQTLPQGERAASVLIRPDFSSFETATSRLCGGAAQQRGDWRWNATLSFTSQVSTEEFEDELMSSQFILERTPEVSDQVTLTLIDVNMEHPPESQPTSGTRVTYRFQADVSPS